MLATARVKQGMLTTVHVGGRRDTRRCPRCGRATTSTGRTEVIALHNRDWPGEKPEKGMRRELKSAAAALIGARASSMTSQRQAYRVSFEFLLSDCPFQKLYYGPQSQLQTIGVTVQHVSFILRPVSVFQYIFRELH